MPRREGLVAFTHLSSLALRTWYTASILRLVILPNLQNIELLDFSRNDVTPFLTRSSCIFERLVISFRGRRTLSGLIGWTNSLQFRR
jgi:hypothetical protein